MNKPFIGKLDNNDDKKAEFINENKFLRKENQRLRDQYKHVTGEEFNLQNFLDKQQEEEETEDKKIANNPKEKAKKELEESRAELDKEVKELKHCSISFDLQANNLKNENNILSAKINNLENVFIGSNIVRNRDGSVFNNIAGDYNLSALYFENTQITKQIDKLELEGSQMRELLNKNYTRKKIIRDDIQENELREYNLKLRRKIEFLQKRERELLEKVMLLKS
eukprot:CAMPEP_0170538350 /NCGR_PEP_ID=MMETSP0209-20121228/103257_1 /TAXON_ID=665100 ORGANISM="Litonotus pictus, Strain P1" /NCGR_SAMPLE_ID=MMETSP0209 /ASSEMBLY_ACC=CAM_ASM_000301 /LENGTH=223 /DNA_ID=CAMNT_0010840019 /DNA_START=729 /DNA_END=1396 /DNA_ORIENTATION=-